MPDDVIICRCEDLTLAEIRRRIAAGDTTLEEIKRSCRCGMGPCQGRTCGPIVAQEIARATGKPLREIMPATYRAPTAPIKLGVLAGGASDD